MNELTNAKIKVKEGEEIVDAREGLIDWARDTKNDIYAIIYRRNSRKNVLTNGFGFAIIRTGDSAFLESLTGRMRHGLKAHLR